MHDADDLRSDPAASRSPATMPNAGVAVAFVSFGWTAPNVVCAATGAIHAAARIRAKVVGIVHLMA